MDNRLSRESQGINEWQLHMADPHTTVLETVVGSCPIPAGLAYVIQDRDSS